MGKVNQLALEKLVKRLVNPQKDAVNLPEYATSLKEVSPLKENNNNVSANNLWQTWLEAERLAVSQQGKIVRVRLKEGKGLERKMLLDALEGLPEIKVYPQIQCELDNSEPVVKIICPNSEITQELIKMLVKQYGLVVTSSKCLVM